MKVTEQAISRLANTMRRYAEAQVMFEEIKRYDIQEAVENLDRAFEAKLEAFHTLFDIDKNNFNYYDHVDTTAILVLRNAIHHRGHELFTSWNAYMLEDGERVLNSGEKFLIFQHDISGVGNIAKQLYRIEDFYLRLDEGLDSPGRDSSMGKHRRMEVFNKIKYELGFEEMLNFSFNKNYNKSRIYINFIPIFMSGICRIFKNMQERDIKFIGYDADTYGAYFLNNDITFNFLKYTYTCEDAHI